MLQLLGISAFLSGGLKCRFESGDVCDSIGLVDCHFAGALVKQRILACRLMP